MELIHFLALCAGLLNAWAFWLYNRNVLRGYSHPPAGSWFMWALVTSVNFVSYRGMEVHWTALSVACSDTLLCIGTFSLLLFKEKFGKLTKDDWRIIALCVVSMVVWKAYSAAESNMLAQIPMVLSFLPMIRDIRSGKTVEEPRVWLIFTVSFVLNFVVVCLAWSGRIEDLIYPLVAITMHVFVLGYAIKGRRLYNPKSH